MRHLRFAMLAAAVCLPTLVAPNPAAGTVAFTGLRPGTFLVRVAFPAPNGCTANFVFQETGSDQTGSAFDPSQQLYLGTAGHCFDEGQAVQAAVYTGNGAPVVMPIGTVERNWYPADDFAIIRLDPAVNAWVSPSTAYFGGPTGVYTGPGGATVTLAGNGGGAGAFVPRVGTLGNGFAYANTRFGTSNMPIISGDSGGPVSTIDRLAVGELTNLPGSSTVPAGINAQGVTISRMLALSGKVLAVCTDGTPWPLPGCPAP